MASDATSPARLTIRSQVKALTGSPMAPYYFVVASVVVLSALGILMVLSASSALAQSTKGDPYYYVLRQIGFLVAGLVLGAVLSRMKPTVLRGLGWPAYVLALVLLLLVFTPLGVEVYGNRNWLKLAPGVQFQPSELAKLAPPAS